MRAAVQSGLCAALVVAAGPVFAGPPYNTDDPEPVDFGHWEFYLATHHTIDDGGAAGSVPHVEVNYGAAPNLQLHLTAPLGYARPVGGPARYGPGDVELGAKLRFVDERDGTFLPMIGTFPQFEIPTGSAPKGLGTGHLHVLVPLWLQKSFGTYTTYGGGGYFINPGEGNRGYWFFGWMLQRRLSGAVTLGAEALHTTPDRTDANSNTRFNVGFVLDMTAHHHALFSAGRSIVGDTRFEGYAAYQITL
jgi:hypothetical protein